MHGVAEGHRHKGEYALMNLWEKALNRGRAHIAALATDDGEHVFAREVLAGAWDHRDDVNGAALVRMLDWSPQYGRKNQNNVYADVSHVGRYTVTYRTGEKKYILVLGTPRRAVTLGRHQDPDVLKLLAGKHLTCVLLCGSSA
jgi:hypothetical protein